MRVHLESIVVIYHPEADEICLAVPLQATGGMTLRPVSAEALHALVGWASRDARYEPRLYRWLMAGWRKLLVTVLRRPIRQGSYQREIVGQEGFIRVTVEHFSEQPVRVPFLKRAVR